MKPPPSAVQTVPEKLEGRSCGNTFQSSSRKISQKFPLFSCSLLSSFLHPIQGLRQPGNVEQLLQSRRREREAARGKTWEGSIGGSFERTTGASSESLAGTWVRFKVWKL